MQRESAETIGVQALVWLARTDDLVPVFLGASGSSIDDLRKNAADPGFLGAVLDFITQDDEWVIAFCDANDLPYTAPLEARAALPGGQQIHWT